MRLRQRKQPEEFVRAPAPGRRCPRPDLQPFQRFRIRNSSPRSCASRR